MSVSLWIISCQVPYLCCGWHRSFHRKFSLVPFPCNMSSHIRYWKKLWGIVEKWSCKESCSVLTSFLKDAVRSCGLLLLHFHAQLLVWRCWEVRGLDGRGVVIRGDFILEESMIDCWKYIIWIFLLILLVDVVNKLLERILWLVFDNRSFKEACIVPCKVLPKCSISSWVVILGYTVILE